MKFMKNQLKKNTPISRLAAIVMKNVLKKRRNPSQIYSVLSSSGIKENMKVLDYGAGVGSYAFEAVKLVGAKGFVIATDISTIMITEIKKEISTKNITNIQALKVNKYTDVTESDFDFILLMDVIHMMDNQEDVIKYFLNKLKPEGKILAKPDHMNEKEVNTLFSSIKCSVKKLNHKNCWLLCRTT